MRISIYDGPPGKNEGATRVAPVSFSGPVVRHPVPRSPYSRTLDREINLAFYRRKAVTL